MRPTPDEGLNMNGIPVSPINWMQTLMAECYDSSFKEAHDTYNGMGTASDGNIYYVLCSMLHDVAGRMFSLPP